MTSSVPPLSPRRRRLRWTLAFLSLLTVGGIFAGWYFHQRNQTATYRPDEKNADITSNLARGLPPDAPRPRLMDVTKAAGLQNFRTFNGQRTSQLPEDMGSGVAWGDFNNDGWEDLFIVSAGGPLGMPAEQLAPCQLYENQGGTFKRVETFPDTRIHGMAAAWGDYDGDGFLDLIVTGFDTILLFHNDGGTGRFTRDERIPCLKGFWSGASWGDYDNDRRLDLYVCGYVQYALDSTTQGKISQQLGTAVPFTLNPASYQPGTNLLFHNNPDGSFTEVAGQLGVGNPEGRSLGALWHDFDDDGWLDLYVANDISDNVLYHNEGGRFKDISHPAWVADYRSAMGLAAGDYDRDGDDDLFIGHWVAQENALYDNQMPRVKPPPQSGANALPPVRFVDVADMRGLGQIALPYVSWGAEFADFDGDGWPDLVVANGSTLEVEGPSPKLLKAEDSFLFWNQRGQFFYNLAPLSPALSAKHVSRGLALADYDNDGALDIAIIHLDGGVQLLHNEMQSGHWIKFKLLSRSATGALKGFGDGAKVIAQAGGAELRRTVSSVSYLSQSSRIVHIGLGNAAEVASLEVRWLGGGTNAYHHLAANSFWELAEGESEARRITVNHATATSTPLSGAPAALGDVRQQTIEFWRRQRAAMDAMKIKQDIPDAIRLFRAALELNPKHEDSRYYLGNCLAMQRDWAGALAQLQQLTEINPQSHRGHAQWGIIRALSAQSAEDLTAAEKSLERAHALNPEETGVLLVLGEVALLRGDHAKAEARLTDACRTNPKAGGGFFLRGYLAWKQGQETKARELLVNAREALGKDWQPKGATSEGDVKQKQHVEKSPLSRYWENWDGATDLKSAFKELDAVLDHRFSNTPKL